jgi:hypothetical protein
MSNADAPFNRPHAYGCDYLAAPYSRKAAFAKERTADDQKQAAQFRRLIGVHARLRKGEAVFVSKKWGNCGYAYAVEYTRRKALKRAKAEGCKFFKLSRMHKPDSVYWHLFKNDPI